MTSAAQSESGSRTTGKSKQELVYNFRTTKLSLDLALGHKYNAWYLIFARSYRLADSREVARLDLPGYAFQSPEPRSRPCFWFDPRVASGWERGEQSLLDLLLSLGPNQSAILSVESAGETLEKSRPRINAVQVLVPEAQLAHWCEGCGLWESIDDESRWLLARHDILPGYLCPTVCSDPSLPSFIPTHVNTKWYSVTKEIGWDGGYGDPFGTSSGVSAFSSERQATAPYLGSGTVATVVTIFLDYLEFSMMVEAGL